jgi:hypothetical protein
MSVGFKLKGALHLSIPSTQKIGPNKNVSFYGRHAWCFSESAIIHKL